MKTLLAFAIGVLAGWGTVARLLQLAGMGDDG